MDTNKQNRKPLILAILISAMAIAGFLIVREVQSQTFRPAAASLATGDIKTSHILNATILDVDISTSTRIMVLKIGTTTEDFFVTDDAQTFVGVKTFSSIPELPAANPTTDNQAVRKKYVDNNIFTSSFDVTFGQSATTGQPMYIATTTQDRVFIDTFQVGNNAGQIIGGISTAFQRIAQSFTSSTTFEITNVRVIVNKVGTPTDNLTFRFVEDNANSPSNNVISSTTATAAADISTSDTTLTLDVLRPFYATATVRIWLVGTRSGALSATDYYRWSSPGSNSYANGKDATEDTGTWVVSSGSDKTGRLFIPQVLGRAYLTNGSDASTTVDYFGLSNGTTSALSVGTIATIGKIINVAANTLGAVYIGNCHGCISSTPGTVNIRIGYVPTTTQIFMNRRDNW